MTANKRNIGIVLCSLMLSMCVVYLSPRFDIVTFFGMIIVNIMIYLLLTLKDYRSKKLVEDKIEDILKLLHSLDVKSGSYEVADDEFGKLRDEIYKIIAESKVIASKAEENQEILREYTEDIAHQIKTPLTGVLLMLDLMEDEAEVSAEYIAYIRNSINRLHRLVDALLKMASLDSGSIVMKKDSISAKSLLEDLRLDMEIYFPGDKDLSISIYGDDFTLTCDRNWTYEAIFNIVKNALEAAPDKGADIHLKETNLFQSIIVKDFGQGLDRDRLKKAYKRFYKENPDSEGYGIGLPMAKSILEKQGGELLYQKGKESNSFELRFYR